MWTRTLSSIYLSVFNKFSLAWSWCSGGWLLVQLLSCRANISALLFDFSSYHHSAHLNITSSSWLQERAVSEPPSPFLSKGRTKIGPLPTLTFNTDLWPEIINIRFTCHLTPKAVIYLFFFRLLVSLRRTNFKGVRSRYNHTYRLYMWQNCHLHILLSIIIVVIINVQNMYIDLFELLDSYNHFSPIYAPVFSKRLSHSVTFSVFRTEPCPRSRDVGRPCQVGRNIRIK